VALLLRAGSWRDAGGRDHPAWVDPAEARWSTWPIAGQDYSPPTAQTVAAARRVWAELAEAGGRLDQALSDGDWSATPALLETFMQKLEAMSESAARARRRLPEIAAEADYLQRLR
jgi:hypothetical protein